MIPVIHPGPTCLCLTAVEDVEDVEDVEEDVEEDVARLVPGRARG